MKRQPAFNASGTGFFSALILLFVLALLAPHTLITVPSGCVGVLWRRFYGTATDFHFGEGLKLILPWDRVFIYNARQQKIDYSTTAPTSSGMSITVEASVTFSIFPEAIGQLHMKVGPDYVGNVILPLVGSSMRKWIASGTDEEHYSYNHRSIENELNDLLQARLDQTIGKWRDSYSLIRIDYFSVRSISLPRTVTESIEAKVAAEQNVRRYRFIIEQSRLEADRRAVEAEGIRRFQEIVSPAISDSFLRWRGIEATLALSQSPNAKIIFVGGGSSGLPLILDGRSETAPAAAQSAPPPSMEAGAAGKQMSGPTLWPPLLDFQSYPALSLPSFTPQPPPSLLLPRP